MLGIRRCVTAFGLFAVLCALPQVAGAGDRVFVGLRASPTFRAYTSAVVAGNAGVAIGKYLQVFGEVGRTWNILPLDEQIAVLTTASDLATVTKRAVTVNAGLRSVQMLGGMRVHAEGERLSIFGETGLGIARLKSDIRAIDSDGSDVTSLILATALTQNLPQGADLLMIGGGVELGLTPRVGVAAGYRLTHLSTANGGSAINVKSAYLSMRLHF